SEPTSALGRRSTTTSDALMTSPGRSERVSVAVEISSLTVPVKRSDMRRDAAGQLERDVKTSGARLDVHADDRQIGRHRRLDVQRAHLAVEDDGEVLRVAEAELAG